jgi:uncharacterized metal-binding protein YceD (DUF177 family)
MTLELSRPFALAHVGGGTEAVVEANDTERAAVAARMGLPAIDLLRCRFDLRAAQAGTVRARGQLRARVVQTCVISLEPFASDVTEDFEVCFVPAGTENEEVDLDAEDEIPYEAGILELGEATAEQLALALDPFPRKPGAALPEGMEEEPSGPMAALAKLRQRQ